jgi:hypothetical protein
MVKRDAVPATLRVTPALDAVELLIVKAPEVIVPM